MSSFGSVINQKKRASNGTTVATHRPIELNINKVIYVLLSCRTFLSFSITGLKCKARKGSIFGNAHQFRRLNVTTSSIIASGCHLFRALEIEYNVLSITKLNIL